ncbi:alpha-amylase family glycosyl hydrolase [Pendulispora albinea]|uniref:Glycosyl hydrolase family 13 catalytic domain-containing protein n=1 Tax=Pendulispora albinea TaxID=2741071 RepID=A0ABZ2LL14_9BACT
MFERARLSLGLGLLLAIVAAPHCSRSDVAYPNDPKADAGTDGASTPPDPHAVPSVRTGQNEVFYFVLPDRFANGAAANDTGGSSGQPIEHGFLPADKGYYHGGDLAGLVAKLDYIKGLGTTAIWTGPIFKNRPVQGNGTLEGSSAGYHGYWTTDYTQIDPHFGTNADLTRLVEAAHARGIKIFFDIIVNHTADVISYREGTYSYRAKLAYPYRDASGRTFDDRDHAGRPTFPALDAQKSFPYTPVFRSAADATVKVPSWLNDPTMYHNRGDTTFTGEDSLYGDFFGLDDLFTERAEVVRGMIDIHQKWIHDFGIDGFRVDTARHVNDEFWQQFVPEILAYARAQGKPDFFVFGEVSEPPTPDYLSHFTGVARFPAVLDFAFQKAARAFASGGGNTDALRDFFRGDDYYIDADSNAYALPTFLGNHDMGRFGYFLRTDNPGAADDELLARDLLGHALMYFTRGMPVVYYGDEQGFTGDGNDKDAREDMFASQVATYNDNDLIGTDASTKTDNYEPQHKIYRALRELGALRSAHPALRSGAQIQRLSSAESGVFAFSRIDRNEPVEYVVALNNAKQPKTVTVPTYMKNTRFQGLYPAGTAAQTSGEDQGLAITVPALGAVVYRAEAKVASRASAPNIAFVTPAQDSIIRGRKELRAELDADVPAEVSFAIQRDSESGWTHIGTDDNPPYRVFYDTTGIAAGTRVRLKAIVRDHAGNERSAETGAVVGN